MASSSIYIEQKAELESLGHRFVTHCDTEILPHLWEEFEEDMFVRLRGHLRPSPCGMSGSGS